jgi:hypothetical protein
MPSKDRSPRVFQPNPGSDKRCASPYPKSPGRDVQYSQLGFLDLESSRATPPRRKGRRKFLSQKLCGSAALRETLFKKNSNHKFHHPHGSEWEFKIWDSSKRRELNGGIANRFFGRSHASPFEKIRHEDHNAPPFSRFPPIRLFNGALTSVGQSQISSPIFSS